jgi:hypothetical protein
VQILIENILLKKSKPKRILFDDNLIHNRTLPSLLSVKFDKINSYQRPESNYPSIHSSTNIYQIPHLTFLAERPLARFNVKETKPLRNELNGILVNLIERNPTSTQSSSKSKSSPKIIEKSPNVQQSSGFGTFLVGLIFVAAAVAAAYYYVGHSWNGPWPLHSQITEKLFVDLQKEFSSQPYVASTLKVSRIPNY